MFFLSFKLKLLLRFYFFNKVYYFIIPFLITIKNIANILYFKIFFFYYYY